MRIVNLFPPDWGNIWAYGCPDNSDKVKDFNTNNQSEPCEGNEYTYHDMWGIEETILVDWKWFACTKTEKCIHQQNQCNSFPHPDCIYEKDGMMIAEDEENCSIRKSYIL